MREHGLVDSAGGLGLHGHACWTYTGEDEVIGAMREFLADGARLGQRLLYVGPGTPSELKARRAAIAPAEEPVEVMPLDAIYGAGAAVDPETLLAGYAARTDAALAAGFTGLRVAADATALVRDPADWERHLRWEALADRLMAERPLAALCCYDRRTVPDEIARDLCAVHPIAHAPQDSVPFRLYRDGTTLILEGEIDYFSVGRLRQALAVAAQEPDVIDLRRLRFVDHHGARILLDSPVALEGMPVGMRRVCELLGAA
jgi:hypothetical protein